MLDFPDIATLNPSPRGIASLKRLDGRVPTFWPIPQTVSSSFPLYMYYRAILAIGQTTTAYDLRYLFGVINSRAKLKLGSRYHASVYIDDFYRQHLKHISNFAFHRTFTQGPKWMLFGHLHALTGKAPFTPEAIQEDIAHWVSDHNRNGSEKNLHRPTVDRVLDGVFVKWYHGEPQGHLSMEDYCNDYIRWGTSGGGPRTDIEGEKYRTKWAWGYGNSVDENGSLKINHDLYKQAKKEKRTASIALKEEAQKTRAVITTPMDSYLRQSYLLYRWGKPDLPSPISSGSWITWFERQSPYWYGCVDGDKFDQTIPAWFVYNVIERLGKLDDECRQVAEDEIESLKTLKVEWRGMYWPYRGGVLSGWRFTSLLGTLASVCAAEYILTKTSTHGGVSYGALGDDLILWSNCTEIEHKTLVSLYNEFGLYANDKKTTSGRVGEFLRKTISTGGSWGYPCLGMRTICYANPWVSSYQFEQETELASTIMTFFSRLIPHRTHSNILMPFLEDLFTTAMSHRFGPGPWAQWLQTPMSVGGGGCEETSVPSQWIQLRKIQRKQRQRNPSKIIPTLLGIFKNKLIFEPVKKFVPINIRSVADRYKEILQSTQAPLPLTFRHDTNITRTLDEFIRGSMSRSELSTKLNYPLPRGMRGMEPEDIVTALLMPETGESPVTTITHTKEAISGLSSLTGFITRCLSTSKRFSNPYTLKPLINMYFRTTYQDVTVPYGTW